MDGVLSQSEKLCTERHNNVNATLKVHDQRFDNHEQRLDFLEKAQVRAEINTQNVCAQVKSLTTVLWWLFGLTLTTGIGFIIWYIQSLPR